MIWAVGVWGGPICSDTNVIEKPSMKRGRDRGVREMAEGWA